MNRKKNKAKFIGRSCQGGCPTSFCITQMLSTLSCSMVVHSCETLDKVIGITRPHTIRNYNQQKNITLEQRPQSCSLITALQCSGKKCIQSSGAGKQVIINMTETHKISEYLAYQQNKKEAATISSLYISKIVGTMYMDGHFYQKQ